MLPAIVALAAAAYSAYATKRQNDKAENDAEENTQQQAYNELLQATQGQGDLSFEPPQEAPAANYGQAIQQLASALGKLSQSQGGADTGTSGTSPVVQDPYGYGRTSKLTTQPTTMPTGQQYLQNPYSYGYPYQG